jgi:hypothetical protein
MMNSLRSGLYMRRWAVLCVLGSILAFTVAGCSLLGEDEAASLDAQFTFDQGEEGWTGAFTDYSVNMDEEGLELTYEHKSLPAEVDAEGQALFLAGRNLSDDLFMFAKRKVTDLTPNTTYNVTYHLEIASNAPTGCVGIGGPPGEAVYLKVGAASTEPESVEKDGHYRLSVDKGNQSQGGENAVVAGTIDNGVEECHETPYRMIERDNAGEPVTATSDSDGNLWLFVGTDSGFEGATALYYNTIEVTVRTN